MAFDGSHNLYIANYNSGTNTSTITAYSVGAQGNATPALFINGANTQLGRVYGIAVDSLLNMYVSNCSNASTNCATGTSSIIVFGFNATGNVAPIGTITGSNTGLANPRGMRFDTQGNLWVANAANASVTMYAAPTAPTGTQNTTPKQQIIGAATGLQAPSDVVIDGNSPANVYVLDSTANTISIFAATATGNAAPSSARPPITGSNTTLSGPSGIALGIDGTLYVANGGTSVLMFAPGSSGNATPEVTLKQASNVSDVAVSI
jgi:sugar lactone lactonase YvrE